jgi:ABC-type branched-subunit amino acid transport system ATPase component
VRLFELRGISKNFGAIQALTEVDLKIDAGEVLGLMGDNGAGKSTLIKIMAGNFLPSSGEIWLKGEKSNSTIRSTRARKASRSSTRTWLCATTYPRRRMSFPWSRGQVQSSGRSASSTMRRCSARLRATLPN